MNYTHRKSRWKLFFFFFFFFFIDDRSLVGFIFTHIVSERERERDRERERERERIH